MIMLIKEKNEKKKSNLKSGTLLLSIASISLISKVNYHLRNPWNTERTFILIYPFVEKDAVEVM